MKPIRQPGRLCDSGSPARRSEATCELELEMPLAGLFTSFSQLQLRWSHESEVQKSPELSDLKAPTVGPGAGSLRPARLGRRRLGRRTMTRKSGRLVTRGAGGLALTQAGTGTSSGGPDCPQPGHGLSPSHRYAEVRVTVTPTVTVGLRVNRRTRSRGSGMSRVCDFQIMMTWKLQTAPVTFGGLL